MFQGYVEGEYLRVAAPVAGRLAELSVHRGATVQPGAPLFALERTVSAAERDEAAARVQRAEAALRNLQKGRRPSEIETITAQLAQADATRDLAHTKWERRRTLGAAGLVPPEELDQARVEFERAAARVEEIAAQLATARLAARSDEIHAALADVAAARAALTRAEWVLAQSAPVAATAALVADTLYVPGEWVAAGAPVVSLLPEALRFIRFFIPEPALATIRLGQAVSVTCDGCPTPIEARIRFINQEAEFTPPVIYSRETRSKLIFRIEAVPVAKAADLHPGQPVEVRWSSP